MSELFEGSTYDEYKKYLIDMRKGNPQLAEIAMRLQEDDDYIEEVLGDTTLSNREFVEVIALCRRIGYGKSIGGANKAAENETDSLYARNHWKFVEEFLQNADDCEYEQAPEIAITVDERDVNRPYVEFEYNEKGFTREDVWSLAAFSDSTKVGDIVKHQEADGVFYREKTGRKGKGFKSVFAIQADNVIVHIRSNGFSFRLDKSIGRILPVWESDPIGGDGKTHVTVELVNPGFSVREIYPELRRMFCADEPEGLFARNPLLFMHRLRSVHVTRITEAGNSGFLAGYDEIVERTEYRDQFVPDPKKVLLAGIAKDGVFYREQLQFGTFSIMSDEGDDEIPDIATVRYTRMVEDESAYRNYSVFAPLLTGEEGFAWKRGSLFRTFTLAMHPIDMPFAIDAPFVLYADRSRIQYNPHVSDEESDGIPSNERNTGVIQGVFGEGGVLASFLLWLRPLDGLRMDRYINSKAQRLFLDQNNSDEHGGTWVPIVDVRACVSKIPILRLMADKTRFVSFDDAIMVARDFFSWPTPETLLMLFFGEDYELRVVDGIYSDSNLFTRQSIVRERFVDSMNEYLDGLESLLKQTEMFAFFNDHLYPFLANNMRSITSKDTCAFDRLRVFISTVQTIDGIQTRREAHSPDIRWVHSDAVPAPLSIGSYRVFESSPVELDLISGIAGDVLGHDTTEDTFGDDGFSTTSARCKSWEDARDLVMAMHHFGYRTEDIWLPIMENYALSPRLDEDFNAFRDAGVVETIDDSQVEFLSSFLACDMEYTVKMLKRMGLKRGDDYFWVAGNYLELRSDTIVLLQSPKCTKAMLEHFETVRSGQGKRINVTYAALKECPDDVLAFLLEERRNLFSADSFVSICEGMQEESRLWHRDDLVARTILIRALAGASRRVSNKRGRSLTISMGDVIANDLQQCVEKVIIENRIERLTIPNKGAFTPIARVEIDPIISMFGTKTKRRDDQFFAGNLGAHGFSKPFLRDRTVTASNIYLDCGESGDYKPALSRYLRQPFDRTKLAQYEEMERQYRDVAESEIMPAFNRTRYDLNRAYEELESRFGTYSNRQVIGILSWFRNSGYANALGNGSINNEREIEDDYRNEPWKFIYEFIQNVDDCSYGDSKPALTITIDRSQPSIAFDYNESGFTLDDIKALTKFGDSNKGQSLDSYENAEGVFDREQTGRKGRGFKSVFALPGEDVVVHVYSNGYSFKFAKCLGSIIPIWEDNAEYPDQGTRIVVEGFGDGYVDGLMDKIDVMLGVRDLSSFFSNCPLLYLRKLKKITVIDGERTHSVDIESASREYSSGEYYSRDEVVSGIAHRGRLKADLWERLRIGISTDEGTRTVEAARYSKVFVVGNAGRVFSVTSPIIADGGADGFELGSVYRTLPLADHVIQVPLAINAPFKTNSGRSAVEDDAGNRIIANFAFDGLLKGFFDHLKTVSGICIESYVPRAGGSVLFEGYRQMQRISLQAKIKALPILMTYTGDDYVSFADAKALPEHCYDWYAPDTLFSCFNEGWQRLVKRKYTNLGGIGFNQSQWRRGFVAHINKYLDSIDIDDEGLLRLLTNNVYPYLDEHYDDIAAEYRKNNKADELKHMKVFAFEMSDGSVVLEDGAADAIWMTGTKDDLRSFGRYRCLTGSSLEGVANSHRWVVDLHEVVDFNKAFTADFFRVGKAKSWSEAREAIETILYYEPSRIPRIPFLTNCALSEELDGERNIFRDAYLVTRSDRILQRVIDRQELESIAGAAYAWDVPLADIAAKIKRMGLRPSREFFETENGITRLNSHAFMLLREYCADKDTTATTLAVIADSYRASRSASSSLSQLIITYEDVIGCDDLVICGIIKSELLSGDALSALARDFCNKRLPRKDIYYRETYLRALQVAEDVSQTRRITINLSEIIDRKLGVVIRECMLKSSKFLKLNIVPDVRMEDYPSSEIDKALRWLDDENALSTAYKYYQADIASAFDEGKSSEYFIFDDTKVLLDTSNAENCIHEFVRRRYRDDDVLFGALVDIIHKQNELRHNWSGTKRQYVQELAKFRRDTLRQRDLLVPGYDDHLNEATGNAIDYVIPELLQNINDCAAAPGQETRVLRVAIDDVAGTMLLEYEEAGFDYSNVYSITAFGQSSKHDESEGEKGLGFKKVFTAFEKVEVYSNGFYFHLTSRESTIPVWIGDSSRRKRFAKDGKTTMVFTAATSQKRHLKAIAKQWTDLVEGNYSDKKTSPVFLRNIDSIYLEGNKSHYSRKDLEEQFVFKRASLLTYYKRMHASSGAVDLETRTESIVSRLLTRKKCRGMTKEEAAKYLESLAIEVCVPRRGRDGGGIGAFYSTLPTEEKTASDICLNIPLELTTGRNGIVESSQYNETVLSMVFSGDSGGQSMFVRLLEEIASEQRKLNMLDAFPNGVDEFAQSICEVSKADKQTIINGLAHARILRSWRDATMVSLVEACGVDVVIYRYINNVKREAGDIEKWMMCHSQKACARTLVIPSTLRAHNALELFARTVGRSEFFPIREEGRDLAIEYLADEYGHSSGGETNG
ncbi:MAG: hypothetical protein IKG18_03080 [Atopobiaceae bacterium]|nr:hypothetical protein [Atopobiaceae bacterium]